MNPRTFKIGATVVVMLLFVAGIISLSLNRTDDYAATSSAPSYDYDIDEESAKRMALTPEGTANSSSQPTEPGFVADPEQKRMLIRNGEISLVVSNVNDSLNEITKYVASVKGFVVDSSVTNVGTTPYGTITFRVPENNFQEAVERMKTFGTVEDARMHSSDVTDQFVDTEARLKNLKATEQQLLTIMKSATKIPDILSVQTELTRVREQIEIYEAQIKNLKNSTSYSIVTVSLSPDPKLLPTLNQETSEWDPVVQAKAAVASLVRGGQGVVDGLIWIAIVGLPILLVAAAALFGGWKVYKRLR